MIMIKIKVIARTEYEVELPVDSFRDIETDRMSIDESNKMIQDALWKDGIHIDEVIYVGEI